MQLKFFLLLVGVIFSTIVLSQTVVRFDYGNIFPSKEKQKIFSDSIEINTYIDNVISDFKNTGYEAVTARIVSQISDTISVVFSSGNAYFYTLETLNYNDSLALTLPEKFLSRLKTKSHYSELSIIIDDYLKYFENRGYPFVEIRVDSLSFIDYDVLLSASLHQGTLYNFDSIVVKGDVRISETFLRQFFNFKKKSVYSEKRLQQSQTLARQLPFMTMTESPQVLFTEDQTQIYLFLKKRKNHSFDGIVGFVPPPDGRSGILLTGDVRLKLNNLFAKGEMLNFDWRSYDVGSQDLNIVFDYPFLFSSPFGTNLKFKLNKKDTSFINTYYNMGVNYYLSGFDYLKGFYESTVSNSYGSVQQVQPLFRSSTLSSYGLEYSRNRLNDALLPTSGYKLITSFAAGIMSRDKNSHSSDAQKNKENQYKLGLEVPIYLPVYKRFVLHNELIGVWMITEDLYENEMLRFGGFNSLKGFEEDEISASTFFSNTIEMRYMIEAYSYFSLFWNGAFYEKKGIESYNRDTPWGVGLGFAFNTPAGIFSINYAMGKQFDNPFDLKAAKVHFGISGKF